MKEDQLDVVGMNPLDSTLGLSCGFLVGAHKMLWCFLACDFGKLEYPSWDVIPGQTVDFIISRSNGFSW